jgi:hypothetical protein
MCGRDSGSILGEIMSTVRGRPAVLLLLVGGAAGWSVAANAEASRACVELRQSIIAMEHRSVRPEGWLQFDANLRSMYQADCIDDPSRRLPAKFWYHEDGTPAAGPPDVDPRAAFAATPEHAAACRGTGTPSVCALTLDNAEEKKQEKYDSAAALPPIPLEIGDQHFDIDLDCAKALAGLEELGDATGIRARIAASINIGMLQEACPSVLAALAQATAAKPPEQGASDGATALAFAAAVGRLGGALGALGPGDQQSPAALAVSDPGFARMCAQAAGNMNTCRVRQSNMRTAGGDSISLGTEGQAGAFDECASLYGSVLRMCPAQPGGKMTKAPAASNGTKAPQPNQPRQRAAAEPNATTASRPPPKAAAAKNSAPQMNDQCRALVQDLVSAAQVGDGPRAAAGLQKIKEAGGCGVTEAASSQATPAASDPRFVERGATPMLDQTVTPCDQQPERCAEIVDQLKAGTSPAAVAAMYTNAIGIGLQLGATLGQGLAAQQGNVNLPKYKQSDMRSLAPAPVRSTYGQGAPAHPAPPNSQSTIVLPDR